MKKVLVLILMLLLLIGVIGCAKKPTTVVGSNPANGGSQPAAGDGTTGTATPAAGGTETASLAKDLNVEKVYWSTIYPEIKVPAELKIIVVNVGREAIDGFDYNVRITKDGTEWKDETKTYGDVLYPGNKTRLELVYTFESEGKYKAEVFVDKDNKIGEKNRFNNIALSPEANAKKASATPTGGSSDDEGSDTGGASSCTDTDSGKDEFTRGECNDGVSVLGVSDYCVNSNTVKEYFCGTDGKCQTQNMDCADGCENGVCI